MELILAPMQGLTEVLFRRVYEGCFPRAFGKAVSPFLSLTHGDPGGAGVRLDDVLPKNNAHAMPLVPQLLGNDARALTAMANRLADMGYEEVNWNLGCPVKRVAHRKRGSGLLPHPDEIGRILDAALPGMRPRLSVKIRLGYASKEEIFGVAPVLNRYPLASVALHPRIGQQLYGGTVDIEAFGEALPLLRHPVVYNGDIVRAQDYAAIVARFPSVAGVMIGRGVFRNPALPAQIAELVHDDAPRDHAEATRRLMTSLLDAIELHAPSHDWQCRKAKEYWSLMAEAYGVQGEARMGVLHAKRFDEIRRRIADAIQ